MRSKTDTVTRTATGKRTAARTKIAPIVIFSVSPCCFDAIHLISLLCLPYETLKCTN
jgi:hypothetical protein